MTPEYSYRCRCGRSTGWYRFDTMARTAAAMHSFFGHFDKMTKGIPARKWLPAILRYIFNRPKKKRK